MFKFPPDIAIMLEQKEQKVSKTSIIEDLTIFKFLETIIYLRWSEGNGPQKEESNVSPLNPELSHWVTLSSIHPWIFNWGFGKRGRGRVFFNLPDKLLENAEGKRERAFPTWRGAQIQGRRWPAYLGCHQKTRRQEESFQTERGEGLKARNWSFEDLRTQQVDLYPQHRASVAGF